MMSYQTIVIELGSSRIKVGFAGESKPRKVFHVDNISDGNNISSGTWTVDDVNDAVISRVCTWPSLYQYYAPLSVATSSSLEKADIFIGTTTYSSYDWEKTFYPLFSHILTSILFIQRPARHRLLLLVNDFFLPSNFSEALHRVLLDYLNVGGVWLLKGGVYEGLYHLLQGMPHIPPSGRPQAHHLIVDIGTFEARVLVSVKEASTLLDTYQTTLSGYSSFLRRVMANYQDVADVEMSAPKESKVHSITLEDAHAIVQAWIAQSSSSSSDISPDCNTISVELPSSEHSQQTGSTTENQSQLLPLQPLLKAFYQIYLDHTNPDSLIFSVLKCVLKCPIDYRKAVLQNIIMVGGGSVALRQLCLLRDLNSLRHSSQRFGHQLEYSMMEACGIPRERFDSNAEGEEERDYDYFNASPIATQYFQSLRNAVNGSITNNIRVLYPDPFAADLASWIGGSIMGTLDYTQYRNKSP